MLRILHLTTDLGLGGRERVVVELCNALLDFGYLPSICCLRQSGEWANRLSPEVHVVELHKEDRLDLSIISPLKTFLVREKIDLLHAHNPGTLFYGLTAAKWAGISAIVDTEHGFASQLSLRARSRDRVMYHFVDRIVSVSEKLRADLISAFAISHRQIHTIRNGISLDSARETSKQTRQRVGMSDEHFNIGIVARLVPVKNHSMLLRAFATLHRQFPKSRLWVIGTGPLASQLEEEARILGIHDSVVFMGSRTDVASLLSALDLFILCSLSEGFSITLIEAMSAGLPIIATRVGGNSEAIEHQKSGLLVESNNPDALAAAMLRVIKDPKLAEDLGAAAKNRFQTEFSAMSMAAQYDHIYRSVLNGEVRLC